MHDRSAMPPPPVIRGRNGTTYQFGSLDDMQREVRAATIAEWAAMRAMSDRPDIVIRHPDGSRTLQGYTLTDNDTFVDGSGTVRAKATGLALTEVAAADILPKELVKMDSEEVLRRRIERARADIDEYTKRLGWLESLPAEPTEPDENGDGPVIFFRKKYGGIQNDGYQYTAVRAGGRWFVTGKNRPTADGVSWRALLAFVYTRENEETWPVIYIATAWDVLS